MSFSRFGVFGSLSRTGRAVEKDAGYDDPRRKVGQRRISTSYYVRRVIRLRI